jgi:hypothetical protein
MKKLTFVLVLTFIILSCSAQTKFSTKFKDEKPSVINGQVTKFEKNEFGTYTVSVTTLEYGKVEIHMVPPSAYLMSIPVYVTKNGTLHYRKT